MIETDTLADSIALALAQADRKDADAIKGGAEAIADALDRKVPNFNRLRFLKVAGVIG